MDFKVGTAINWGKRCPLCANFLFPKHIIEVDAQSFIEKEGFCLGAQNFYNCNTCHSRFEAIATQEIKTTKRCKK
jgi:hypothetical protein